MARGDTDRTGGSGVAAASTQGSLRRDGALDTIRGVAILLVVANHLRVDYLPAVVPIEAMSGWWARVYWKLIALGWTGVDLFFVLSGYLISGLLFDELDRRGTIELGRFWLRRGFKIWPSYYALIAVLLLSGATTKVGSALGAQLPESLWAHLLFLQNYLPHNPYGPTWSLAVEEHFYLLLPLLLLAIQRLGWQRARAIGGLAVGALLVGLLLRTLHALGGIADNGPFLSHLRLDSLMVGVLCQQLRRTPPRWLLWARQHRAMSAAFAAFLISPALFYGRHEAAMFTIGYALLAVGFALALLLVVDGGGGRAFASRPAVFVGWVGRYSYNTYLWHLFLGSLALPLVAPPMRWIAELPVAPGARRAVQMLFFNAASLLVGWLMTHLVEQPFLRLRSRVYARELKQTTPR